MRKFYLLNEKEEWIPLQGGELFFAAPSGLGFGREAEYAPTVSGFFGRTQYRPAQRIITGVIVLREHLQYARLAHWLAHAGGLRLVYLPAPHRRLFIDVDATNVSVKEKTRFGVYEIEVTFCATSPFYLKTEKVFTLKSGSAAVSTLRFPFGYPFIFSGGTAAFRAEVAVAGDYPAGVEAVICAPVSAPVLTACMDGAEIGRLDLSAVSLGAGEQILFSSTPGAERVCRVSARGEEDLLPLLDIAHNNFFTLPPGKRVTLAISAHTPPEAGCVEHTVKIREYVEA